MADVSKRIEIIFRHPKKLKKGEQPKLVGVTFEWLCANGLPQTVNGKPYIYQSVELIH
jgi:hypothetical protein